MKKTKTQDRVNQVYLYLKHNFYNKTFNFKEVERYLMDRDIHGITFYYFVYAGVIDKVSRGCYKINESFLTTDTITIYKKAKEQIEELRKKRNKTVITRTPVTIYTPEFLLNETDCIAHLKKLGYKIMKPIQQFEEI